MSLKVAAKELKISIPQLFNIETLRSMSPTHKTLYNMSNFLKEDFLSLIKEEIMSMEEMVAEADKVIEWRD